MAFSLFKKKDDFPDWIKQQLTSHPAWKAEFAGKRLCPYCTRPVVKIGSAKELMAFIKHLKECPRFGEGEGKAIPAETNVAKSLMRFVKGQLTKNPSWTVLTPDLRWVCPYTGQITDVQFPKDKKLNNDLLKQMIRYLKGRSEFSPTREVKDPEYLRNVIHEHQRRHGLADKIRKQIGADESLRYTDRKGRWICPWCQTPIASVDVATEFAQRNSAPTAIANHLSDACGAFKAKKPKLSVSELDAIFTIPQKQSSDSDSDTTFLHAHIIEELKGDIASMRDSLTANSEASKTAQEMEKSLAIARDRQLKMLPTIPEIPGLELDAWYSPCATVSGDFYDFIKINDTCYGVLVGDVSGHGIEAALIMSMAKKALQMHGRGQPDPVKTLSEANEDLFNDLEKGTFLTVFYAIFDMENRTVTCCRAGHNPMMVISPETPGEVREVKPPGMGVGMNAGPIFNKVIKSETLPINPGETFVIYTDGISEAMNKKNEEYGFDRFKNVLGRFPDHEPKYLMHLIRGDVETFCQGRPPEDDMTILLARVSPE